MAVRIVRLSLEDKQTGDFENRRSRAGAGIALGRLWGEAKWAFSVRLPGGLYSTNLILSHS